RVRCFDGFARILAGALLGGLLLPLAACAQSGTATPPPASAQSGAESQTTAESFDSWLAGFKQDAIGRGISRATVESALAGLQPLPEVIQRDRSQREFTLTFTRYMRGAVTESRVEKARRLLAEHRVLLDKIAEEYGVQPRFLVSFWGLESNFGEH